MVLFYFCLDEYPVTLALFIEKTKNVFFLAIYGQLCHKSSIHTYGNKYLGHLFCSIDLFFGPFANITFS